MRNFNHHIGLDLPQAGHVKKKIACPSCGKKAKFVRYYNFEKDEYLPEQYGRCDRQESCGYHLIPEKSFWIKKPDPPILKRAANEETPKKFIPKPKHTLPTHLCHSSLHGQDNFTKGIQQLFGNRAAQKVLNNFLIGTSPLWQGATIFWQMDADLRLKAGKVMQYGQDLKRVKTNGHSRINWVHSLLKKEDKLNPNFELEQCFFGEHQLHQIGTHDEIVITESAKNAVLGWLWMPQYIWLSSEGANGLKIEKCSPLLGRTVYLLPDFSEQCRADWYEKGHEIAQHLHINFRLLQIGETINDGSDIADLILNDAQVCDRIQYINKSIDVDYFKALCPPGRPIEDQFLFFIKYFKGDEAKAYDVLSQIYSSPPF
ncbi:DUF6371 domain-containing protein [Persicobacter diffluens]|uniref:Uncharacterized protein n=1 Tax=Persicobacter diffluens TaxID=981 RepID=A0AAN4VWB6_9BACT|nr:hypothetical protein PEDI_17280 [Persicobacter diffluens]